MGVARLFAILAATVIVSIVTAVFLVPREKPALEYVLAALPDVGSYGTRQVARVEVSTRGALEDLFEEHGFIPGAWKEPESAIPPLVLVRVPAHFDRLDGKRVSAPDRKSLFFRIVLPLVLIANQEIARDRATLEEIADSLDRGKFPKAVDVARLQNLATAYRIGEIADTVDVGRTIAELRRRIDIVPVSLAVAQAAAESGWGTSRFAAEGNALFGQWTFNGKGMTPKEQRAAKGDYRVAAFRSPLDSVRSYMRNLNTNRAYRAFRDRRAAIRASRADLSGTALLPYLEKYSERGKAYLDELATIIRVNKLAIADGARLGRGDVLEVAPTRAGSS